MELKNIIYNHIDLTVSNDYAVKVASRILNDNLIIRVGQVPTNINEVNDLLEFNNQFNWDIDYGPKTNMTMFHLHAFEPVKYLLQAYEVDENLNYLRKSIELIESWSKFATINETKYTWYDHCVAERTLIVLLLKIYLNKIEIHKYNEFLSIFLKKHQSFLGDQKNYIFGNHGLMMDRSLYLSSKYLKNSDSQLYIELALRRINKLFKESFSSNGINYENSISYHLFNLDLFLLIEYKLLRFFGDSVSDDFEAIIQKAIQYISVFTQPNKKFPNIGDGERYSLDSIYSRRTGDIYRNSAYLTSDKLNAHKNYFFKNESVFYHKNGPAYLSFISGKRYNIHKHGDDLSLTYSFGDDDLLVDCGTFTYQKGEFRHHFMSAKAHNGLLVNGEGYPFLSEEKDKIGLLHFEENEDFTYIVGKNDLFDTVNINRHIIITKMGTIIIHDELLSDFKQSYEQNFNLHPDFNNSPYVIENQKFSIRHPESKYKLSFYQHHTASSTISIGNSNKPDFGIYSEKFYQITPIYNLRFETKSNIFLTSIEFNNGDIRTTNIIRKDNTISFKENNNEYSVKLFEDKRESNLTALLEVEKKSENIYTMKCFHNYNFVNPMYAWYIYRDGEILEKIWYDDNNEINYSFKDPGNYRIQYYILDRTTNKKVTRWYNKTITII